MCLRSKGEWNFEICSSAINQSDWCYTRCILSPSRANIALVGHTGSGKPTITSLIAKFYLPTTGQFLIDGREIHQITSPSLHHQIGMVLQQNFLFTGTVMENIRFGRPEAADAEVIAAAERLDRLDLIEPPCPRDLQLKWASEAAAFRSASGRSFVLRGDVGRSAHSGSRRSHESVDPLTELRIQAVLERLPAGGRVSSCSQA